MGRRHAADSETAAIATERLALLLADLRPRRALPETVDEPEQHDVAEEECEEREEYDEEPRPPKQVAVRAAATRNAPTAEPVGATRAAVAAEPVLSKVAERLPDRARSFGRRHLGVLAVVVVIGLVAAGWALLRARPVAVATPLSVTTSASGAASGASSAGEPAAESGRASPAASPEPKILVHVVGAVRKAGVVSLTTGARVEDAIDAAGGLTADARPGELNLAQVVQDGQQVVIGTARHPGGEVRDGSTTSGSTAGATDGGGGGTGGSASAGVVDLNAATLAQLDALPGVGPVTAERILAWRTEHGRFSRVAELQEVDGIGPKTYAQIAPHVRV